MIHTLYAASTGGFATRSTQEGSSLKNDTFSHQPGETHSGVPFPSRTFNVIEEFQEVQLPSKSVLDLVKAHGEPYYIKIDVERFDALTVRSLLENGIHPPFISAESHSLGT